MFFLSLKNGRLFVMGYNGRFWNAHFHKKQTMPTVQIYINESLNVGTVPATHSRGHAHFLLILIVRPNGSDEAYKFMEMITWISKDKSQTLSIDALGKADRVTELLEILERENN